MESKPDTSFRTEIDIAGSKLKIDYTTFSMWMGSCFVENIGGYLRDLKFPVSVNPFGVLYNPVSIKNSLSILTEKRMFSKDELFTRDGLWHSFSHHSSFSHPDRDLCLENINEAIITASDQLKNSVYLFITFGTARVYQYKETGEIVSNNHKIPHSKFNRILLSIEEITEAWVKLINELLEFNKNINIVFTLSPVRHWKDGATGNLISKSTLALAISNLVQIFDKVSYFPAYEIVMDDLRDYRFYDDDMLHINKQGTDYIWKKFSNAYISSQSLPLIREISIIKQGLAHRPFNPDTREYNLFLTNLLARIGEVEMMTSSADFSEEKEVIRTRLKNY